MTDRPPARLPDTVWAPLTTGLLMLLVGGLGVMVHQVWLFPSLGPTVYLQAEMPDQPSSRLYNTVMGHALGVVAGLAAVLVFAQGDPPVFAAHVLTWGRVLAGAVAVALTSWSGIVLKASHPPAAATTLLIALGGFRPNLSDMLALAAGVVIVALAGECLRRIRAVNP